MIVAEQKPLAEIIEMVSPYGKLLILGCGTCVKTCFAGGEEEVAILASLLRLAFKKKGIDIEISELTIERQCENEFIQEASLAVSRNDAVLSLACGAGVQDVARRFTGKPVLPGLNTTFVGVMESRGLFTEECLCCGDCRLGLTGGVCVLARCAKKLSNGPCGGSRNGKCEVNPDSDCAWQLVIDRMKNLGTLDKLREYTPPRDWRSSNSGGPRKILREDMVI
ncbi:MAG: methylenetetrahydrofolate reductase C-terminal domain-containing protein [Dehalococcoidales bacterium]|jgi:ferredoxin|nr:methylenetetrahydrofolate reductase C-terminal domain-containing protein [Dehalococcoidales bacterium]MDD4229924.1 methylenetetrahydrofolate reductase C-terminal domain-containing protein [Dehalococcoidales bacterium]MDD4465340.1 methylenetetrahydrofolate reductase C-terminal domain-containing protein [Dehalococcoidales bacterium]MDD5401707.1 methylenetetrahydrofolate reductase C-terminal domain-containing protein [Dehalococcoidales bacterium]